MENRYRQTCEDRRVTRPLAPFANSSGIALNISEHACTVIQGMLARQRAVATDGSIEDTALRPRTAHRLFTWRHAILGGVAAFALLGMGAGGWMGMRALGIGLSSSRARCGST